MIGMDVFKNLEYIKHFEDLGHKVTKYGLAIINPHCII